MSDPTPTDERDDDPAPEPPVRCVPADSLLAGDREVWIEHHGVRYLLRVTRRGRLILTK